MQRKKYEIRRGAELWTIEPNMFPSDNREAAWQVTRSGQNNPVLTGHSAAAVLKTLVAYGLADEAGLPHHLLDWKETDWP